MQKTFFKTIVTGAFLGAAVIAAAFFIISRSAPGISYATPSPTRSSTPRPSVSHTPTPTTTPRPSPTSVNLDVQFFSQAPRGDWSLPWQEACEEASAILVGAYWTNEKLTLATMEQHILDAVAWQKDHFGFYQHTTAQQTADMLKALYGLEVRVEYDIDTERIAEHVRAGRPVIVPLAGRLLGNPYYTSPGPVYHMLVVRGVTADGDIITNDVGTRRGQNFTYRPDVFLNAMHDVPSGGDTYPVSVDKEQQWVESGRRAIIIVYPNS